MEVEIQSKMNFHLKNEISTNQKEFSILNEIDQTKHEGIDWYYIKLITNTL